MERKKFFVESRLRLFGNKMVNTSVAEWLNAVLGRLMNVLFSKECILLITSYAFLIHALSLNTINCASNIPEEAIVEGDSNIFHFYFINYDGDVNFSEFLAQSNPRFALRTEHETFNEKEDICNGTHVDSEEDFCSNKIPKSDHIPIIVREYVMKGKYDIEFGTLEMLSTIDFNPLAEEGVSRSYYMYFNRIAVEQFDVLEKFMLRDYDVTMLDITKSDFYPMWYFIDMLQIKPSLATDWFLVKFFKKSVLLSEIYKEYFLDRNPEWVAFFSDLVSSPKEEEDDVSPWTKILEIPPCPKTEEDCDFPDEMKDERSEEVRRYGGNQVVNIDADFGKMFGLLFSAIFRSFYMHLSYSVSRKEFVLENFTDQCFSENMMDNSIRIENNIKFKIVTDVIQKLHAFCSFRKYKHILAIFLGSRVYNSLEVTNIGFEPSKEYRSPAYKKERINDTFNFDGPEPPSAHNTLRKVFISDSFKRIRELKLNMVALGELDPNRLYDLRHLERLEILNPGCKEVQRCVTKVLRCNINMKFVKLFQINISQWFLESISKISPETIILKKCTLETDGADNQANNLRILPKEAKFISSLKKFVLQGEKKYFLNLLEHVDLYQNLEFLSFIDCFNGNITKDFIVKISSLKNLKVLRFCGNNFEMDIDFLFLNQLVDLKEIRLANCRLALSRLSILDGNQPIHDSLVTLSLRSVDIDGISYLKSLLKFKSLESLDLRDCAFTSKIQLDSNEVYLPPSLKSLNMDNINFPVPSMVNLLNGLEKIESVSMKGFDFSNAKISQFLEILKRIVNADFSGCNFEGVGVYFFKSLTSIEKLKIFGAKFSPVMNMWKCLNSLPKSYNLQVLCLGNVVFDSPIVYSTSATNIDNISSLRDSEDFFGKTAKLDTLCLHLVAFSENSLSKPILERFYKLKSLNVGYDVIFDQNEQISILKKKIPANVLKVYRCSKTGLDVSKDTTEDPVDDDGRGEREENL